MSCKHLFAPVGVFTLAVLASALCMSVSSASPSHTQQTDSRKPSGLTAHDIAIASASGLPSRLVTMAPQSSLKLLSRAVELGPHAPRSRIELTIALRLRNVAQLKQFLRQVQYPGSPAYHEWLTPREFTARYAPSRTDVERVVKFLETQGIKVQDVSSNRILIHTEATTTTYQHVFGIGINNYKLNGRHFYSTADRPKLPRAIAPLVLNVLGLNHGVLVHPHSHWAPLMSAHGLGPRQAPPVSLTFMSPLQISHAYNWPDITDASHGKGVSIAILTANSSGLAGLSDPHDFWAAFGLPDHPINVIPVDGDKGETNGTGESLLDIEYSGAMGPGATLNVYVAADAYLSTFTDMYNQFANDNTSAVMTTSWGAPESTWGNSAQTVDQIFMQAAAQGIAMFAAAGDHGSSDNTGQNNMADYPSSSPYVTASNGTQLTISDLSGTYGSEVVWNDADCFGNGRWATGGAISMFFNKPVWQHGAGVSTNVDMRMNSGIALTASCSRPMLVLSGGRWYGTAGTSAVSPQLAGLFAIVVDVHNGRLGQANSLIYEDARQNYASDFHDITSGNNGAYQATDNWDHPTGWGSVNAQNLIAHLAISGPRGTLSGRVTAAASGSAIGGAHIVAVDNNTGDKYGVPALDDGSYSLILPVGNFEVTVSAYAYKGVTASVSISDGNTTTESFALQIVPTVTLSGKVTDGSGHGYGLYADIKINAVGFGQVADVWTDPANGNYSVQLPQSMDYTLDVAAAFNGYETGSTTVTLSGSKTKNFVLAVSDTCTAPGYKFVTGGISADFNGSSFPPAGWTVANAIDGSPVVWGFSTTWGQDNWTGGTGTAAAIDSGGAYPYKGPHDASLITPPIAVTALHGAALLTYKANFRAYSDDALDLDISTDGGSTWINILHWTKNHGGINALPGENVIVHLDPYLPGSGTFRLRWRDFDTTGLMWDYYAQIDDAVLGSCLPESGGLVTGQVTDARNGEGLVRAEVTDDLGQSTTTIANPADPGLPVGTYLFFATDGPRTLTVTKGNYTPATSQVALNKDQIVTRDFALKGAKFVIDTNSITMNVSVNGSVTSSFRLNNVGSGAGRFKITGVNAPPPTSPAVTGPFAMAPLYPPGTNLATLVAPNARPHATGIVKPAVHPHAAGDVVDSFPAGLVIYSLGADHNSNSIWVGSPTFGALGGDDKDHRLLLDGSDTGDAINVAMNGVAFMADIAFDDNTATFWQISVETSDTSHIYEYDPVTLKPTGSSIIIPSPQSERGLAYNPLTNTWYAGDYNSRAVYHFDASGALLDSVNVGLPITGLAYNAATGHLFVLTSGGQHAVYVLDADNNYARLSSFDVSGFSSGNAGAGLGYTCDGNLIISDFANNVVYIVDSGENAWCAQKGIPWLTVSPAMGTLAPGATATMKLTFNGSGQEVSTSTQAYLRVDGGLDSVKVVPITVIWVPNNPPVAQDATLITHENSTASDTLVATDPDANVLAFSIVALPTHGTVVINDTNSGAYTYTPNEDYSGPDRFTFRANDGVLDSNVAAVNVSVKEVAPPPPPSGDGGGGSLSWLVLASLLGLALMSSAGVRRYKG